jgi:hypothetical protein
MCGSSYRFCSIGRNWRRARRCGHGGFGFSRFCSGFACWRLHGLGGFLLFPLQNIHMPARKLAHLFVGLAPVGAVLFDAQRGFFEHRAVRHGGYFGGRVGGCISARCGSHLRGTGVPEYGAQDGQAGLGGAALRFDNTVNLHLSCPKKSRAHCEGGGLPTRRADKPWWLPAIRQIADALRAWHLRIRVFWRSSAARRCATKLAAVRARWWRFAAGQKAVAMGWLR